MDPTEIISICESYGYFTDPFYLPDTLKEYQRSNALELFHFLDNRNFFNPSNSVFTELFKTKQCSGKRYRGFQEHEEQNHVNI